VVFFRNHQAAAARPGKKIENKCFRKAMIGKIPLVTSSWQELEFLSVIATGADFASPVLNFIKDKIV